MRKSLSVKVFKILMTEAQEAFIATTPKHHIVDSFYYFICLIKGASPTGIKEGEKIKGQDLYPEKYLGI